MARNAKQIIEVELKDDASDGLDDIADKTEKLDKADPNVKVDATDNASGDLEDIEGKADQIDKSKTVAKVDAKDNASPDLEEIQDKTDAIDSSNAVAKVGAKDDASDQLSDIRSQLERLDGEEAEFLLKAEAKDARADLRAAQRELIALDDEEAEVLVKVEITEARARLEAIDREMKRLDGEVANPTIEARDAAGSGTTAGNLFSGGAVKAIAGSTIVATIISVFNQGMEKIQLRAKFESEFGLVKADAKRLGKEAGDIYAGGWGESSGQVLQSIGLVNQALVETGRVSKDETSKITTDALAISSVYETDVAAVIRATSLLLSNGLAKSATEATDLIVQGLQDGGNQAGDFFETIDEYSQHFDAMGLSGADMMAIITHGLQNGQRDADKMADAVKEMRLRTTDEASAISDAYARIGLDADDYRAKVLAGGPSAKAAYSEILAAIASVEDPVARNAVAVQLIGTQYEDLGPKALESLQSIATETDNATGATEKLVEQQDKATSQLSVSAREAKQDIADLGGAIADSGNSWAGLYNRADQGLEKWQRDLIGTTELTGTFKAAVDQATVAEGTRAYQMSKVTEATGEAGVAADAHTLSLEAEEAALKATNDALLAAADSLLAQNDAKMAAADATFALNDAEDNFVGTLATSSETLVTNGNDLRAVRQAMDDAAKSAGAVAQAQVRVAEETAAADGKILSATSRLDIMNGSMLTSAASASGPLRQSILDYIGSVNGIPTQTMTDIQAAIDRGDIAEANRLIDDASRARRAAVTADANTAAAEGALNNLARPRSTSIDVTVNQRTGKTIRNPGLAKGSGGAQGGPTLVGEQGPEIVNLNRGDTVATAESTSRVMGGSGTVVNNYFNMPSGITPEAVAASSRAYLRRNGVPS